MKTKLTTGLIALALVSSGVLAAATPASAAPPTVSNKMINATGGLVKVITPAADAPEGYDSYTSGYLAPAKASEWTDYTIEGDAKTSNTVGIQYRVNGNYSAAIQLTASNSINPLKNNNGWAADTNLAIPAGYIVAGQWFHFKIQVSGSTVTYTIGSGTTTTVSYTPTWGMPSSGVIGIRNGGAESGLVDNLVVKSDVTGKYLYADDFESYAVDDTPASWASATYITQEVVVPDDPTYPYWIWSSDATSTNNWTAFRKQFTVADVSALPDTVNARIAAETKYWLYVNGDLVVFEGSLKRGPNKNDGYVDNVDLKPYLVNGTNTIAILATSYGRGGYSSPYSGMAGLFFDAADISLKSDDTWKAIKVAAYGAMSTDTNYRLAEWNLKYDAQQELGDWQDPSFNDTAWPDAFKYGQEGSSPWNNLVDRPVPLFKFDAQPTMYPVSDPAVTTTTTTNTTAFTVPVADYAVEARFQINWSSGGIVFDASPSVSNTFYMWQIEHDACPSGCTPGVSNYTNNTSKLRPHRWNAGSAATYGTLPSLPSLDQASAADKYGQWITLKVVLTGSTVQTYVNGTLEDTRTITRNVSGAGARVGFRTDNNEKVTMDYFKVTSTDGSTVYLNDDCDNVQFVNANSATSYVPALTTSDTGNAVVITGGSGVPASVFWHTIGVRQVFTVSTGMNRQLTPYVKLGAGTVAGKTVGLKTDHDVIRPSSPATQGEYVTKAGAQEYESLTWMNGDQVIITADPGAVVEEIGYRFSGYNSNFDGSFVSDDTYLNTLWEMARNTLYVTMRDNYMDCPDREKSQWWGDAVNEIEEAIYALDPAAADLGRKGITNVIGFRSGDSLPTQAPAASFSELPAQSLAGVMSFYMFYSYTGDASVLTETYGPAVKYLKLYNMDTDGLLKHDHGGTWHWHDWGSGEDGRIIDTAWYYIALNATINSAKAQGISADDADVVWMQDRADSIKENFDKWWNTSYNAYYDAAANGPDDRANALAVFAGLASEDKYPAIKDVLTSVMKSSPYMDKYALEALYLMGYPDEAIARMKDANRYAAMVADTEHTTLWEFFPGSEQDANGTFNHGWTGGPLTMLSRYASGIQQTSPGFATFKVDPQLGSLKTIQTSAHTVKGVITVGIDATDPDDYTISTTVPSGTKAVVTVPFVNGNPAVTRVKVGSEVIWQDGAAVEGASIATVAVDDEAVYFEVSADTEFHAVPCPDKTALKTAESTFSGLDEDLYTTSSYNAAKTVAEAGAVVVADLNADQTDIDNAASALDTAIQNLVLRGNPANLEASIAAVEALINAGTSKYTDATVAALDAALTQAKTDLAGAPDMVTAQLEAANTALLAALQGLTLKPAEPVDTSVLQTLKVTAAQVDSADYTPESYQKLADALDDAQTVLSDPTADQDQVDAAAAKVAEAVAALKPVEREVVTVNTDDKVLPSGKQIVVTKVKFGQSKVTLAKGKKFLLRPSVYFTKGTPNYTTGVTYKSSNPKVASVDKYGQVTAKKTGTAKITATSKDKTAKGKKLSATYTVKVVAKKSKAKVSKVSLSVPKTMKVGEVRWLTGQYAGAQSVRVTYKTLADRVVTIDRTGRLAAVSKGTDTVIVKAGNKTKKYTITVK